MNNRLHTTPGNASEEFVFRRKELAMDAHSSLLERSMPQASEYVINEEYGDLVEEAGEFERWGLDADDVVSVEG
jgi:hypothetical protein